MAKKDDSKQARMYGRVAKTPISNTFNELVEMYFLDCGDYAELLHIQDVFPRLSVVVFTGAMKRMSVQLKWSSKRRFRIG